MVPCEHLWRRIQELKMPYTLLLLKTGSLPIEIIAMERVVEYMLKIQKCPSHWLPRITWEASKKIQKMYKSKILCSRWMQDMGKGLVRRDATHLLHDASLHSVVWNFNVSWHGKNVGRTCFTYYTTHVAPNYKTIFFDEQENRIHQYMLEPISLSAILTIASMWLSSHALRCETRRWGTSDESGQLNILYPKQVREFA